MSMMGGTTIAVEVDARVEDLGQFYRAALKERGYTIDDDETKDGRRTIYASDAKNPAYHTTISIVPKVESTSEYTLIFLRIKA